ncbi:MAG: DUF1492 domain-containing protein [Lachnospiraceae bacterium]|nr:DUF1492 domain-containing protein [Lachnospiraceae bacterium]
MAEKKTDAIKRRLQDYTERRRDFENENERYIRLYQAAHSPKTPRFDAIRKGSPDKDLMGNQVAELIEMEKDLKSEQEAIIEERKQLQRLIKKLKKADERAVIRMKYLDGMDWVDIAAALYRKQKDYKVAEQAYLDKAYKLHGAALLSLSIVLNGTRKGNCTQEGIPAKDEAHTSSEGQIFRK